MSETLACPRSSGRLREARAGGGLRDPEGGEAGFERRLRLRVIGSNAGEALSKQDHPFANDAPRRKPTPVELAIGPDEGEAPALLVGEAGCGRLVCVNRSIQVPVHSGTFSHRGGLCDEPTLPYVGYMIRLAISQAAFDAIASTMPLGSVAFEAAPMLVAR
jgi:hypothetical protein